MKDEKQKEPLATLLGMAIGLGLGSGISSIPNSWKSRTSRKIHNLQGYNRLMKKEIADLVERFNAIVEGEPTNLELLWALQKADKRMDEMTRVYGERLDMHVERIKDLEYKIESDRLLHHMEMDSLEESIRALEPKKKWIPVKL